MIALVLAMVTRHFLKAAVFSVAGFASLPALAAELCLNAGVQYKVGEYACIAACHGDRRLARCDALAQTASWTYISDACPSAMINQPWPSEWTEIPVVAAMTPIPLTVNLSAPTPAIQLKIASYRSAYQ